MTVWPLMLTDNLASNRLPCDYGSWIAGSYNICGMRKLESKQDSGSRFPAMQVLGLLALYIEMLIFRRGYSTHGEAASSGVA